MNEYQKALNIYSCLENEDTVGNYTPFEYRKAKAKLQELVDKETSNKLYIDKNNEPIFINNLFDICPICGHKIGG